MRGDNYETKHDIDDLEALSEKLQADLRANIHMLQHHEVLSPDWCEMAGLMGRIATISEMEAKLPKDSAQATLWECEEVALRYILEDGKLNLCVRNLVEYWNYKAGTDMRSMREDQVEVMDKFEKGLGLTLRNAWKHSEAIQTTDLPLLVKHISDVLLSALEDPTPLESHQKAGDLCERQESLVLHYLKGLCQQAGEISEDRFMPVVMEQKVLPRLAEFLQVHHGKLRPADLLVGAQALAAILDTEDFQTYEDSYLTEREHDLFIGMRDAFLEDFTADTDARRTIRPLLDFVSSCGGK